MRNTVGDGVARIVAFCSRHARLVILAWMLAAAVAAASTSMRFAIDTDSGALLSRDLPWQQRQIAIDAAFPQRSELVAIVIDGRTPGVASRAAAALAQDLGRNTALFNAVWRPDGGDFFERNGLLFVPMPELRQTLEKLIAAQPLLGPLAQDPHLRGLMNALALFGRGATQGGLPVGELTRPFRSLADTLEAARDGRVTPLAWHALLTGEAPEPRALRRFVLARPVLDYGALEPGARATSAVRDAAARLGLTPERGVRVRLTGSVPLADEEFATIRESAGLSAVATVVLVVVLLWVALRSLKLIAAIVASLLCGLAVTAALGLAMVGAFNLISVAFAVLFVGLGVDFAIQLAVAYRAQRFEHRDLHAALRGAGGRVGHSLALAAAATAIGFLAFLPTAYRGVAELGLIAGVGMLIAFAASVTLLPSLLAVMNPRGEAVAVGFAWLAPADDFLRRRARAVVIACAVLTLGALAVLPLLTFDFNPLNLRSAKVESVSTLLDLAKDPQTTPNTIELLAADLATADALAKRIAVLPEVAQTLTLSAFVPDDQEKRLALIEDAAMLLGPALIESRSSAPSDTENARAMAAASRALGEFSAAAARSHPDAAAEARRLADVVSALASGPVAARERAYAALIPGLTDLLAQLRTALAPSNVTRESLPQELKRDWITPDGRARIEVYPAGDSADNRVLGRFVDAVRTVAPEAAGAPVTMKEAGAAIVEAFVEAGAIALAAIAVLLAIALRRTADVLLTLAPLVLAGVLTLALCVVLRRPLNYANIIALPLLFGIGVAFNIYFVNAWRAGARDLLASSLARAVVFSALTTASAFGSLWLSSHPGTASMGELLALSLACTLACALVFLPALLASTRR